MHTRQAAALTFKNFIKKHWPASDDGSASKISQADRVKIKGTIIDLMVKLPDNLQKQVSEAVSEIGKVDFPAQLWPELLPKMVAMFATGDFNIINGVLRAAHPLFKRYRFESRSDKLWTEIAYVLGQLVEPLTQLFAATIQLTAAHQANPAVLKTLFHSLVLISKLFFTLNFQDIPEAFEDRMPIWFGHFHTLLGAASLPALAADDESAPGLMEELKTQICENVKLYTTKYDEEFNPYVGKFVEAIWSLLTTTDISVKNDPLCSAAMKFLAGVCERPCHKALFENPQTLASICEKVVVPSCQLRECDEELFEDDADEYIRRDIEGSDLDTRRRGATDLVNGLCQHFEGPVTQIFTGYIKTLLQQAAASPDNWKSKDAAIYLVTAIAAKSRLQGKGVTKLRPIVNVVEFFGSTIVQDLQNANANIMLKADAIKYVLTFRQQLSKEQHMAVMPMVVQHLTSDNEVVMSYAAFYVERVLAMKRDGAALFSEAEVGGMAQSLLTNLFGALNKETCQENEYLMKTIMRTISTGKTALAGVMPIVIDNLSKKMLDVAKNPGKAKFNHYMFEAMSSAVRFTCDANPAAVAQFEAKLFQPFELMLTHQGVGIPEFQPYVFQILAQMLEVHKVGSITQPYMALWPFLTQPALWETIANSPPLVRLINAFLEKGGPQVLATDAALQQMLGIFQRLASSKKYDKSGFELLGGIINCVPLAMIQQYLPKVLGQIMTRMQKSKTLQLERCALWFISVVAGKYGGSLAINMVDSIQPQLWAMLITRLMDDVDTLQTILERKAVVVGLTRLLTDTPEMVQAYQALWVPVLTSIIKTVEVADAANDDEEDQLEELEKGGYQTTFNKLAFSKSRETDYFPDVPNPVVHFATALCKLGAQMPGRLAAMIPGEVRPGVDNCLQKAGIAALP